MEDVRAVYVVYELHNRESKPTRGGSLDRSFMRLISDIHKTNMCRTPPAAARVMAAIIP